MNHLYNRDSELKERFNRFIADKITSSSEDYYSRLTRANESSDQAIMDFNKKLKQLFYEGIVNEGDISA
jgi:hypothetical protein